MSLPLLFISKDERRRIAVRRDVIEAAGILAFAIGGALLAFGFSIARLGWPK
jgi:hypothetical protein